MQQCTYATPHHIHTDIYWYNLFFVVILIMLCFFLNQSFSVIKVRPSVTDRFFRLSSFLYVRIVLSVSGIITLALWFLVESEVTL